MISIWYLTDHLNCGKMFTVEKAVRREKRFFFAYFLPKKKVIVGVD